MQDLSQEEDGRTAEEKVIEPSEFDMAQLRHEMRELYRHVGFQGSLQVLYEMIIGANVFAEIIAEEHAKESGDK